MSLPNLLTRQFDRDWLFVLKNVFTKPQVNDIRESANILYNIPEVKNSYMKFYETKNKDECILSRIENFVNNKNVIKLKGLLDVIVTPILEEVLEKCVNLFKDKINWKLSGGGAFKAHQDFGAWTDFPPNYYVTCVIFIDNCTLDNRCLEMVSAKHKDSILKNTNGCLDDDVIE